MMRYLSGNVSPGFVSLYTGKAIMMFAGGLLGLFLPIFLFNLFDGDLTRVMLFYVVGSLAYALSVGYGVRILNWFGFRRSLIMSTFFGALFYVVFSFINKENALPLLALAIVVLTLNRISYWIPYIVDFAQFTDKKNRGKELGILGVTRDILGVLAPLVAGFILSRYNFTILFVITIILFLVKAIPYFLLPETHETYQWGYRETWRQFVDPRRRRAIIAFFADGAESTVALEVWPIFIYLILHGDYLKVGAVSTIIVAVTVALQLAVGRYVDLSQSNAVQALRTGTLFYSIGWVLKMFVLNTYHIFILGAYHGVVKIVMQIPFDALTYELAADSGHYVDEFTVLHEMAVHIGKALMALLVIAVAWFLPIQWTFLLAACASMALNMLRHERPPLLRKTSRSLTS